MISGRLRERRAAGRGLMVGICGRAGAGKTTLSRRMAEMLHAQGLGSIAYSGDWRFIMDSEDRKRWLAEKWKVGLDAYTYAMNQFSWWDFARIYQDLLCLKEGRPLRLENVYDRASGRSDATIDVPATAAGAVLYENCILGGVEILDLLDLIVLVNTPDVLSLKRVLRKDAARRSVSEITARYLMTTYSENIFLELILNYFRERMVVCDSHGRFGSFPEIRRVNHIPAPIPEPRGSPPTKGTVFCDLDGTVVKHVPIPSETGDDIKVLEGSVEKLREFRAKGYYLVLTTSRAGANIFRVIDVLRAKGLEFDQIVCDLPIGPRHLINDSKDGQCRAFAYAIPRDGGITGIDVE